VIYLAGYAGWTHADLVARLTAQGVTEADDWALLDIRHAPFSRFSPEWDRATLAKTFQHYQHYSEWGNLNYKRNLGVGIMVADYAAGRIRLAQIPQKHQVLLCACRNPATCHRTALADLLRLEGLATCELRPEDVKPFTPALF